MVVHTCICYPRGDWGGRIAWAQVKTAVSHGWATALYPGWQRQTLSQKNRKRKKLTADKTTWINSKVKNLTELNQIQKHTNCEFPWFESLEQAKQPIEKKSSGCLCRGGRKWKLTRKGLRGLSELMVMCCIDYIGICVCQRSGNCPL